MPRCFSGRLASVHSYSCQNWGWPLHTTLPPTPTCNLSPTSSQAQRSSAVPSLAWAPPRACLLRGLLRGLAAATLAPPYSDLKAKSNSTPIHSNPFKMKSQTAAVAYEPGRPHWPPCVPHVSQHSPTPGPWRVLPLPRCTDAGGGPEVFLRRAQGVRSTGGRMGYRSQRGQEGRGPPGEHGSRRPR